MKLLFECVCIISLVVFVAGFVPKDPSLLEVFEFVDKYHPSTPLYNGVGDSAFPISTTSEEAYKYFNMGINMLHSFWPSEAIRAFRHVISIDKSCAIAYWGLYQAFTWDYGFVRARQEALAAAEFYSVAATEREQLYIRADLPGNDWNATYWLLMQRYPWDLNAKSFWAWGMVSQTVQYMDDPLAGRGAVQDFLQRETIAHPHDVGLLHFQIHAWEDSRTPAEALGASQILPTLAPKAAHIVHMPGHIYHLLGDHDTAHTSFLSGFNADERAMSTFNVTFQEYWEYIHNIAYMTGNLGEGGRHSEALKWATFLQALDVNPGLPLLLDWDPVYNRPAARYYFQGLVALPLLHFQYSDWDEAQTALTLIIKFLQPAIGNTPTVWLLDYFDALKQYACVMGAFETSDYPVASSCYSILFSRFSSLAVFMNRSTENGFAVGARSYAALGVNVEEASGIILAINQQWDAALQQLLRANASEALIPYNEPPIYTRPVLESVAGVYLHRGNLTGNDSYIRMAAITYSQILESPWHNNSGFGWFGIGYSYSLIEDVPAANYAFRQFLAAWATADANLPQVIYAKLYLNKTAEMQAVLAYSDQRFSFMLTLSLLMVLLVFVQLWISYRVSTRSKRNIQKYVVIEQ
eukprot:Phypoly_transcript_05318.p1 GENE.Phypoly_transcript_05318~~Phypoly_transcript_05318.p1  ORF type:complete len:636 (+),score=75.94 Phypoly_transcript_05318:26-1933(+)